jgi:hypothetical protein
MQSLSAKALCKVDIVVQADSTPNAVHMVTIDGVNYHNGDTALLEKGDHTLTWTSGNGGVFGSWGVSGNISVDDANAETTTLTVTCGGTLTLNLIACASGEQIVNGGFETGDFTGWTKTGDPWIVNWDKHSGIYGCETWTINDSIEQEFGAIAYECISTFKFWTKQSFDTVTAELEVTVTYDDDTQLQWIEGHRGHVNWIETDVKAKLDPTKKVKKIKFRQIVGVDTNGWVIDDATLIGTG